MGMFTLPQCELLQPPRLTLKHTHVIQICSGIANGRVLDGELLYIKILEVNLFAFANANKLTSRIFVIVS